MKNTMLLFVLLLANAISAQIKVKINDNLIAENALIKADEIKKFEIGFDKPKLLKDYGYGGVLTLEITILEKSDNSYYRYYLTRNGTNAIEAFLEEVNTFKIVYIEGQSIKDFIHQYNFIKLLGESGIETVTLKMSLYFKEKIGYERYGDPINLIKPFVFKVDNKQNVENYHKIEEEGKVQKAEEKKAAEEKDKKDKKITPGKVLRGIFGR